MIDRLTMKAPKNNEDWSYTIKPETSTRLAEKKLGQLEDLETELGVELITLFKALNSDSIWCKKHIGAGKYKITEVQHRGLKINKYTKELSIVDEDGSLHLLVGYGSNWSLTRKELEK